MANSSCSARKIGSPAHVTVPFEFGHSRNSRKQDERLSKFGEKAGNPRFSSVRCDEDDAQDRVQEMISVIPRARLKRGLQETLGAEGNGIFHFAGYWTNEEPFDENDGRGARWKLDRRDDTLECIVAADSRIWRMDKLEPRLKSLSECTG